MYSETILEHFANPRNAGELPDANARAKVSNPVCGDVLELAITVSHQRVQRARFRAKGCVPLMACSSILTEMIEGLTLQEAASISTARFLEKTGALPQASSHAAEMAIQAVRQVLQNLDTDPRAAKQDS